MTRLTRVVTTLAIALGMAAVVVPSTAAAAPAAATAWLLRTQFLAGDPNGGDKACQEREIYLAKGHYNWGLRMGGSTVSTRPDMQLDTGTYLWRDCLTPDDGFYIHTSSLGRINPGGDPASTYRSWRLSGDGTYTWGSFLDPKF
jgi:hypothetical protein